MADHAIRSTYFSDEEDQAICQRFILHGGSEGYGMCYLFGYYRHAGHSREDAVALICKAMTDGKGKDSR